MWLSSLTRGGVLDFALALGTSGWSLYQRPLWVAGSCPSSVLEPIKFSAERPVTRSRFVVEFFVCNLYLSISLWFFAS